MQVAFTCTLSLPKDVLDINELEQDIVAWGRVQMARAFALAWEQLQANETTCPHCGSVETVRSGRKPYQLRTSFGSVELGRQRRRCRTCGRQFQPGDALLHGAGAGRATRTLLDAATLAAASWPFVTAADILERLSGAEVSPEWIRQVAEGAGQAQAATTQDAASRLLAGQADLPPAPDPAPERGLVACDGGYVHTRAAGAAGAMEGKVAVLATGREPTGRERWRLTGRRYVATFASAEQLAPLTYQAAAELGLTQAEHLVVLGDGAAWISELAAWCFPDAERRLDLWHLLRRGHEAVVAEDRDEEATTALWTELRGYLRTGAVDAALALIRRELHGDVGQRFAGYLAHQRPWIRDTEQLQEQGEVVGSGAIEKGVDLVINRRFKGRRGMRWGREAATAIVTLRTAILNNKQAA
jgi:hypothetical protein